MQSSIAISNFSYQSRFSTIDNCFQRIKPFVDFTLGIYFNIAKILPSKIKAKKQTL